MKSKLFLASVLLLISACTPQSHQLSQIQGHGGQTGIFGGSDVRPADAVAAMTVSLYHAKHGYICSGALFGKNMVISAAHCVLDDVRNLEVRFGVDVKNPSVIRKVVAGQINSKYTGDISLNMGDISLLKYEGTIPEGFAAAPFLKNYSALEAGTRIVAAGYGVNGPTRKKGAGTLRKITLKVKNPAYSSTEISVDHSLLKGVCSGDSGGPAFYQGQDGRLHLWGVTSNGAGVPILRPCMFFSVFTRLDSYLPWLLETAERL